MTSRIILQPDTGLDAKPDHFVPVLGNRDKMTDRMEHGRKLAKAGNPVKNAKISRTAQP